MPRSLLLTVVCLVGCADGPTGEPPAPMPEGRTEGRPIEAPGFALKAGEVDCLARTDTGYQGGGAFPIRVITLDGKPVEESTADAYFKMRAAAGRDGVWLHIVSGFRTHGEQSYLYGCYVNCDCNGCNLAAYPGYSNHQSGYALDLNTTGAGVLGWLNRNASRFGFSRTVPSEDWHWEYRGGAPAGRDRARRRRGRGPGAPPARGCRHTCAGPPPPGRVRR